MDNNDTDKPRQSLATDGEAADAADAVGDDFFFLKVGIYGELYPSFPAALRLALNSDRPEVRTRMVAAFGLTPAEIRLTLYLVTGGSLAGYAARFGLGLSTVRTHLKSVFAKTGVSRQARLADLLAGNQGPGQPKTQF
jgi:DNA-binding CsgD family transcriptional regulator